MLISKIPTIDESNVKLTIASGFIVIKDNKLLLTKEYEDDYYKFPGGRAEDDESLQQTAIRELKEETSITAEIAKGPIFFNVKKEDKVYILVHYLAKNINGEIKINDPEIEEARYFDLDNLPQNLCVNIKPVLKEFLD